MIAQYKGFILASELYCDKHELKHNYLYNKQSEKCKFYKSLFNFPEKLKASSGCSSLLIYNHR